MGRSQRLGVNRVSNCQRPKGETDAAMAPQGPKARHRRLQTRRTTPSRQESRAGVKRIPVKQWGVQRDQKGIILILYCREEQQMNETIYFDIVIEYGGLVYCVSAQQRKILI